MHNGASLTLIIYIVAVYAENFLVVSRKKKILVCLFVYFFLCFIFVAKIKYIYGYEKVDVVFSVNVSHHSAEIRGTVW